MGEMNMGENYYYITPEHIEIAEKNGISYETLKERVYRLGWHVDKAATKPLRRKIIVPDELMKIADEIGIEKYNIGNRLRQGWRIEEACTKPKKKGYPRQYPDWVYKKADENGIRYNTVNKRVKNGFSLEMACTMKPLKRGERLPK